MKKGLLNENEIRALNLNVETEETVDAPWERVFIFGGALVALSAGAVLSAW